MVPFEERFAHRSVPPSSIGPKGVIPYRNKSNRDRPGLLESFQVESFQVESFQVESVQDSISSGANGYIRVQRIIPFFIISHKWQWRNEADRILLPGKPHSC